MECLGIWKKCLIPQIYTQLIRMADSGNTITMTIWNNSLVYKYMIFLYFSNYVSIDLRVRQTMFL